MSQIDFLFIYQQPDRAPRRDCCKQTKGSLSLPKVDDFFPGGCGGEVISDPKIAITNYYKVLTNDAI